MLREIKMRERDINKCILGPRKKLREGIDYRMKLQVERTTTFFLSHSWARDSEGRNNHERVLAVGRKLQKLGFDVVSDDGVLSGKDQNALAVAVHSAAVVLVFITRRYIDRVEDEAENNCRFEWRCASNHKKVLYPVVMERFLQDGSQWGPLITASCGDGKFSSFTDDSMLDSCCEQIVKDNLIHISK